MVTTALQDLISQGKSGEVLRTKALQEGMVPLRQDGWNRVIAGVTTVEEVVRVTSADAELAAE
jgi:type II secretory ATPase GspE/PulE/Tfp pilus assembly ATPase PilB-like protein